MIPFMAANFGSFIIIFVGLIFFATGTYWILNEIMVEKYWRLTSGQVLSSEYISDYDSDGSSYWLDIDYSYVFSSKSYTGNCCTVAMDSPDAAEKFVETHNMGRNVKIYVNPSNPSESRMKDDLQPFSIINLFFAASGLVFVVAGFGSFFAINQQNPAT